MHGHWSRTCRTADHLVKLYKASQRKPEANFLCHNSPISNSYLESSDALLGPEGKDLNDVTDLGLSDMFFDLDLDQLFDDDGHVFTN